MTYQTQDTFLHMRIASETRAMLDEIRRVEQDLPGMSEMVRRLIERSYKAINAERHRRELTG